LLARQAADLITNLVVHADRMEHTTRCAAEDLLAARPSIWELRSKAEDYSDPARYLGATEHLIDVVMHWADRFLKDAGR
jgi:hypothetical protein